LSSSPFTCGAARLSWVEKKSEIAGVSARKISSARWNAASRAAASAVQVAAMQGSNSDADPPASL
jgi:hypothetical protein